MNEKSLRNYMTELNKLETLDKKLTSIHNVAEYSHFSNEEFIILIKEVMRNDGLELPSTGSFSKEFEECLTNFYKEGKK